MIEVQNLTKEYGRFRAVDDLSFRVAPGEVLGFLGPNGAGKTTTMRIVAGFLPATAGRVLVCGSDIETQAVEAKRRVGYLPEGAPSYPEMTPRSFLDFIADVRGLSGEAKRSGKPGPGSIAKLPSYLVGMLANLSGFGDEVARWRSGDFHVAALAATP